MNCLHNFQVFEDFSTFSCLLIPFKMIVKAVIITMKKLEMEWSDIAVFYQN
jgi:hypothetical protein